MIISQFLTSANSNPAFTFLVSCAGILGFLLSIYLSIKSNSISKQLKIISAKKEYNMEREIFSNRFKGHRSSIIDDNNHSRQLIHLILEDVYSLETKYTEILRINDKIKLIILKHQANSKKPNFEKICGCFDYLIARLQIKED